MCAFSPVCMAFYAIQLLLLIFGVAHFLLDACVLLQLRGVLDKVLSDESDMKAIHLTGK